jgi:hypothetical protein
VLDPEAEIAKPEPAASLDEASATAALLAAADGRALRFHNASAQEHASRVLERLGANAVARQYEMRLGL